MRKYAVLREPLKGESSNWIYKIMLYEADEGIYLFEYNDPDAVQCFSDILYDSLDALYDEWNDLLDDKGWIEIDDPLPDCQQDAFLPVRVKGRDMGKPEWGKYEVLQDGNWVDYNPD